LRFVLKQLEELAKEAEDEILDRIQPLSRATEAAQPTLSGQRTCKIRGIFAVPVARGKAGLNSVAEGEELVSNSLAPANGVQHAPSAWHPQNFY
jgi:hypothetical protein